MSNFAILLVIALAWSGLANAQHIPSEQAQKNGVRTCQRTVEQLATHLLDDRPHGSTATWNNKDTDGRLFNANVVVRYSDGHSVAVLNAAPTRTGGCDSSYTTVFVYDESCSVARETHFKNWLFSNELAGLVVLANKSKTVRKTLMPSGSGCTVVSTEVIYG